jgi:hypothetical protein
MIMCTIIINQELFGLVGDTYNAIFACVVFGLSSVCILGLQFEIERIFKIIDVITNL